jgi:FtsP/CotA-like multicopper oxidase with cupredoxin domain
LVSHFLQVCKDDLIVVDVTNKMAGTAATIHWHGFHHRDTPFMDGVPFVTQCPIDFSNSFRYAYWATEAGTQFYHSHTGHHKVNGHFGGIIVRQPPNDDVNRLLYDEDLQEHMVIVADWMHEDGEMFMPGNPSRGEGIQPNSLLINGKGTYTDVSHDLAKNKWFL